VRNNIFIQEQHSRIFFLGERKTKHSAKNSRFQRENFLAVQDKSLCSLKKISDIGSTV